jgi:hypothetical protein
MPTLVRLEAWSDYQCASGTRQAVIPISSLNECTTQTKITREDTATIELAYDAPGASSLSLGGAVRWLFDDGTFDEWRVAGIETDSSQRRMMMVRLRSPLADLQTLAALITLTTATVTVTEVEWPTLTPAGQVANILAFCPAYWTAGTITPTTLVSLSPRAWMPLKALRELITAVRAQGVSCELDYDRNGTTGYRIQIPTTIGASATALDVRSAKNLVATRRSQVRDQYALEVVPLGDTESNARVTMARGWIEVTNKASAVLTVQQPVTAGPVVLQDDQWNGLYLIDDANAKQQVTDSVGGATQTLTVASGTNFTAGRWYRYALNSSGDDLIRMRALESVAGGPTHPVDATEYDSLTNVVGNPAQSNWTGALPVGWTKVSGAGTVTKDTTEWLTAGWSARIQGAVTYESPPVSLYVPATATAAHFSLWIYHTASGTGDTIVRFFRDATQVFEVDLFSSFAADTWVQVTYAYDNSGQVSAVRSYKAHVITGSGADTYVDSAQVTFSAAAVPFREGSHPTRLLSIANRYLSRYRTAPEIIDITFADLAAWDAARFPYETVTLGQTVNVRDTVLNLTTSARLVDLQRNWKELLKSLCTISSTPEDLTTALTGI